jgi:hypothetical protein
VNIIQVSASERGIRNLPIAFTKNIVTDYGAVGDGVTSDYAAFKAFFDWGREQTGLIRLDLPPTPNGAYYKSAGAYGTLSSGPFAGIRKLIVMGYGAAIDTLHGGALANSAVTAGRSPIRSVSAGSSVVELIDIEDAAKYTVGRMALIAGLDLQQGWGYPPNPHFMEWKRIVSIDDEFITLSSPLKYDYKDDWPRFFEGNSFELGGFGPATICMAASDWDCAHAIYGLTSVKSGQTYYFYRKARLYDVKAPSEGFIIGASEDIRIVGQEHTLTNHEVDKLATKAFIGEYGPANKSIHIQSSSVDEMEVRGGTRSIVGTARHMLIHGGSSPEIRFGPVAYGISESIKVRDHIITTGFVGAPSMGKAIGTDPETDNLVYQGDGVFRCVDPGVGSNYWFVPGAVGVIGTAANPFFQHSPFRITRVRSEDGEVNGATIIETTLTGPDLPVIDGQVNGSLLRHAAPNLTVINCTGCQEAEELSLVAPNSPYGIFKSRTLNGLSAANEFGFLLGRLVHLKVNVTQPYTGSAGTLNLTIGGQFGCWLLHPDMTWSRPQNSRINLKVAGERVITPSGVTGTQTGDTNLSAFAVADVWMPNNFGFGVYIGNGSSPVNISGEDPSVYPSVTVEILTDQEIPAAA